MIQRASDTYLVRLYHRAEEGGAWHLHHRGIDPPTVPELANRGFTVDHGLAPIVNDGRWIVLCPHCGSAQLTRPGWDRFLCVDCANVAFGGLWLHVEWPDEDLIAAGEAALDARPDPSNRNWDPTDETIGYLLCENGAIGGLVDPETGAVAGDIGADYGAHMVPSGELTPALPKGEA